MKLKTLILAVSALLIGPLAGATNIGDLLDLVYQSDVVFVGQDVINYEVATADLKPLGEEMSAGGRLIHASYYDTHGIYRQWFSTTVAVVLPNEALRLTTIADAEAADIRIMMNSEGVDTAECFLAHQDMPWDHVGLKGSSLRITHFQHGATIG